MFGAAQKRAHDLSNMRKNGEHYLQSRHAIAETVGGKRTNPPRQLGKTFYFGHLYFVLIIITRCVASI